jgi:hypothetical protein
VPTSAMEVQICDAIVGALNDSARGFSQVFTAERNYLPEFDQADLKAAIKVSVLPQEIDTKDATRDRNAFEYTATVDVQKAVDNPKETDGREVVDGLCKLTEEIHDYLRSKPTLAIAGPWKVIEAQRPLAYSPERLYAEEIFESVVNVTVKGVR